MKRIILTALVSLAVALPSSSIAQDLFARVQTAADQDDVYFIAQLKVDDMEAFQSEYVPGTAALLGATSALVLAVSPAPMVVEGTWDSNWTVLMRFENQADFDEFYKDGTYQEQFIPIRTRAASINNVVILPAFDPAVFGG
ncbi:DUF1330 domain-containing protein [uncultured Tateyamaria sp.]|uniref:DUF1330 domain-containing protein n=1 Tax=uncultured Tateyamaria sp. TaxID=455651 RepID=UPI002624CC89|nr:DUF1330 domain-containing protein [uncultured Tateyamaria sp.]